MIQLKKNIALNQSKLFLSATDHRDDILHSPFLPSPHFRAPELTVREISLHDSRNHFESPLIHQKSTEENYVTFSIGFFEGIELSGSLYCPIESNINVLYEFAKEHTKLWVLEHGLFKETDKGYQKFCKADFSKLVALSYQSESLEDLKIVSDFVAWLFCHDDARDDEKTYGLTAKDIKDMNSILFHTLKTGEKISTGSVLTDGLASGLKNIRDRLLENHTDIELFVNSVDHYFQANLWESANRTGKMIPSVFNYVEMRQSTSAVYPCFELGCLTRRLDFKDSKESVLIKNMARNASNVICFINDIFSFQKEMREGVIENLIVIQYLNQMKNHKASYLEVLENVCDIIKGEVDNFFYLKTLLSESSDIQQFVNLMESWMKGNLDWSQETSRYNKPTK